MTLPRAREDMRALHGRVDERFFGRRFYRVPTCQRTLAFFAFESVLTNLHAHSLWRITDREKLLRFHRFFEGERGGLWNDIVESGSYKLRIVDDHAAATGYVLKEQHMGSDDRLTMWSDEFHHNV
ncbi:MAG: hypothetical protein ACXW36_02010 [Nitrospira sp.]